MALTLLQQAIQTTRSPVSRVLRSEIFFRRTAVIPLRVCGLRSRLATSASENQESGCVAHYGDVSFAGRNVFQMDHVASM